MINNIKLLLINIIDIFLDNRMAKKASKLQKNSKNSDYIPMELADLLEEGNPYMVTRKYYGYSIQEVADRTCIDVKKLDLMEINLYNPTSSERKALSRLYQLDEDFFINMEEINDSKTA